MTQKNADTHPRFRHRVPTGRGADPASYWMGKGHKSAGMWNWLLTSI